MARLIYVTLSVHIHVVFGKRRIYFALRSVRHSHMITSALPMQGRERLNQHYQIKVSPIPSHISSIHPTGFPNYYPQMILS